MTAGIAQLERGIAARTSLSPQWSAGELARQPLYLLGDESSATRELARVLAQRREWQLLALELRARHCPGAVDTGFRAAIAELMRLDADRRRAVVEHPVLRIWLPLALAQESAQQADETRRAAFIQRLADYPRIQAVARRECSAINKGAFILKRFDVDPLIAEVVPPSYVFDDLERKRALDARSAYTLDFLESVLRVVVERIAVVWPEAPAIISAMVPMIIHLPDLNCRSCSAQRFAGVVLLSVADDHLLAVEESLIHESGHQILYAVMDLHPLIHPGAEGTFNLPWSGAERDAYGYFHATYIYLVLACYFEAVIGRCVADDERVTQRLGEILLGLDRAIDVLADVDCFTPAGRLFFDALSIRAREIIDRNRRLICDSMGTRDGSH